MKNTRKKFLTMISLIVCALLLVAGSIAGTYAYLTSTATTQNTFTVGNVLITMDEANVDELGTLLNANRVTPAANFSYKLIPGRKYVKNPVIHVDATSENCWLFVEITDEIAAVQDTETIAEQLTANNWVLLGDGVYYHNGIVPANADRTVFEYFKIKGSATHTELSAYAGKNIIVNAYAVQAEGFNTAADAWAATFGAPANP